jgi:Protein of unknown function (DUF2911)
MSKLSVSIAAIFLVLSQFSPLDAQKRARISPHDTTNATIDGDEIEIVYGRPYTKDPKTGEKRKIWGGLVPFEKVWRLGADEATLLTTKEPLELGGKSIPAGSYTLFMLPHNEKSATLIVNKQVGQWGTKYDEKQDFARVDMKGEPASSPADQLAIAIDSNPSGGGTIKVTWETTQYSVDFKVQK